MLPGGALVLFLTTIPAPGAFGWLLLALHNVCLSVSANYVPNGWRGAEFDRHHLVKKFRSSAAGPTTAPLAYALRTPPEATGRLRRASHVSRCVAHIVEHREDHHTSCEALGRA